MTCLGIIIEAMYTEKRVLLSGNFFLANEYPAIEQKSSWRNVTLQATIPLLIVHRKRFGRSNKSWKFLIVGFFGNSSGGNFIVREAGLMAVITIQYNGIKASRPKMVSMSSEMANFIFRFAFHRFNAITLVFYIRPKPLELKKA